MSTFLEWLIALDPIARDAVMLFMGVGVLIWVNRLHTKQEKANYRYNQLDKIVFAMQRREDDEPLIVESRNSEGDYGLNRSIPKKYRTKATP